MSVSRETPRAPPNYAALYDVSRETKHRLDIFASLLATWTSRINLISRSDLPHLWPRHIADSLQLAAQFPPNIARAIDMGSGAGFPGLVLAVATNVNFDLIESDQRKAAFLREAARRTGAPVTVHACRIEAVRCPPAMLITARALAPLTDLLAWAHPLLIGGGSCLFPKGRTAQQEIDAARRAWTMRVQRHISRTDRSGVILRISEIEPA
jgi:16S rRNA (guanine527-N7)-methyltransferase